jgi:hypothetical protein
MDKVLVGAGLFAWQLWLIRNRDRNACFRAFLNNNHFGLMVFAGVVLSLRQQVPASRHKPGMLDISITKSAKRLQQASRTRYALLHN